MELKYEIKVSYVESDPIWITIFLCISSENNAKVSYVITTKRGRH